MSLEPGKINTPDQESTPKGRVGDFTLALLTVAGAIFGAMITKDVSGALLGAGAGLGATAIANRLVNN